MGSNVSHFRGCFGSWFIRYLALRRISGSARQTTVSSVPVVSASRTVAKPRLYIGFFSCHNSIPQVVIGVGPTDQWSITACHVHRRPEAERKKINWDHIALRGNQKGDGPKSLVASELLRIGVSESSVKATLQQLFSKTGVRTRSQLVRITLEQYTKSALNCFI